MQQEQDVDLLQPQPPWSQVGSGPMGCNFDQIPGDLGVTGSQTPINIDAGEGETLLDRILEGKDRECTKDRNPALWMRSIDGDEYTGPSSGISTISDLGLNWVRHNVPDSQVLCETIQDIRNGVLSHLRQPKCVPQVLPLVVSAPFIFPVLDRAKFLSQLETYGTRQSISKNPSWQALLSAVLASGCRAALSAETAEAFKKSGQEAWGYFQNALSFEPRIAHGSTDLMAVQAIAIMTIFAQGLSGPQRLEYTLSSIAARLAQSVALNRHPSPHWSLSEEEQRDHSDNLQPLINSQMHSSQIEAARSMVLLTKHLDIESFTPAWLVFYYPFTALTTILVHIVCNPPGDTTQSGIALMETVVGFFGRLEYVTSGEAAFTKTTEFVRQARNIHSRYSKDRVQASLRGSIQVQDNNLSIEVAGPF
ncbi:unnamed protein product [Clonostachys rhizophaga]|uniref:Xylanolytic transcriptional activator regulatory domain-containing protein n=1 Tax=Clonostachys rhizophaga TaxID=160324 RepID=A0A9N9VMY4_9HYPO|nr:unnamed protein product [Clonostachys rhizophaga]